MSDPVQRDPWGLSDPIGLCAACRHVKVIENRRGSRFHLCMLSEVDARYPKYPRLPVLKCEGYEFHEQAA